MGEKTNIEWTNATFNPWTGCRRVSAGCKNCYMFELLKRWGRDASERRRTSPNNWKQPLKWNEALSDGPPRLRVFPSLCDWLDDEVPIEWLADFMGLVCQTPNLDWLLLTKRPENWNKRRAEADHYLRSNSPTGLHPTAAMLGDWHKDYPPENVWLGVSVETQARTDERMTRLLEIPARVRFLSAEPLLEKINLIIYEEWREAITQRINWVIVGGESGPKRRDCGVEAIEDVARQCRASNIPVFVKQDCALRPGQQGRISDEVWKLKQFPKESDS